MHRTNFPGRDGSRCANLRMYKQMCSPIFALSTPTPHSNLRCKNGRSQKGGFQKGGFWRMFPVPPKPERGHKKQNDRTGNRTEATLVQNGNDGIKTGTRTHSPKPPFYKTALLFPLKRSPRHAYAHTHTRTHSRLRDTHPHKQQWSIHYEVNSLRACLLIFSKRALSCNFIR